MSLAVVMMSILGGMMFEKVSGYRVDLAQGILSGLNDIATHEPSQVVSANATSATTGGGCCRYKSGRNLVCSYVASKEDCCDGDAMCLSTATNKGAGKCFGDLKKWPCFGVDQEASKLRDGGSKPSGSPCDKIAFPRDADAKRCD